MIAEDLPFVNAVLNGISTVLLVTGYVFIKRRHIRARRDDVLALVTSTLFLIGYVAHKLMFDDKTSGLEPGLLKNFYLFVILLPHVVLAMVMLPMIILTLLRAYWRQWDKHRWIARPTFWIWLYVSITGVIIYWMLYHLFPAIRQTS